MRSQRKAGGDAVGLAVEDGDDAEGGVAEPHQIAAPDMQPVQQGLFRRRAADAVILAMQDVAQASAPA